MHEMSIAQAILDLARRHVPAGAVLRTVRVRVGPLRGIDPQCMQWAWQGLMAEQSDAAAPPALELTTLPWQVRCADCGDQWSPQELPQRCACGSERVRLIGGDEFQLVCIEVDEQPRGDVCKSKLSKTC
ncbi:MAG: hydrogenase maturation nickel metallochaperone HypA [Tepidisphaeraceae bacterium]|jgi:hydrogenase nickel incorporation protein HypA/HybF